MCYCTSSSILRARLVTVSCMQYPGPSYKEQYSWVWITDTILTIEKSCPACHPQHCFGIALLGTPHNFRSCVDFLSSQYIQLLLKYLRWLRFRVCICTNLFCMMCTGGHQSPKNFFPLSAVQIIAGSCSQLKYYIQWEVGCAAQICALFLSPRCCWKRRIWSS
jgi:hypothetical protein